ncbi:MAG: phage tail protein [Candidatus Gastranaerophilaceae bacterium]
MKKNKILLIISLVLIASSIPQPAHADPILFTIGFIIGFLGETVIAAAPFIVIGGLSWGISALSGAFSSNKKGNESSSPTYQFGALATQQNNTLPIPIIYGKVKAAGNIVWQSDATQSTLQRLVSYADGPIHSFLDIRLNDTPINELSGCNYTAYTGTANQTIDGRVTGSTDLEKVKFTGGLKNTAYLAFTALASDQLSGNFTSTAMIKGSLVRKYTDLTHFTDGNYSNNPAWCILDFLTRYNGCGFDYSIIDIQSFIDVASYCDVLISNTMTGTVSTSGTTVTGTNTKFKTEASIDDTITISTESRIVTAITDDLSLTVDSAFTTVANQTAIQKQPRFTLNFILDERKSRLDWIAELCLCFQGNLIYQQGKLVLNVDKPDIVMQVFDKNNIIDGSETFNFTTRENRYDIAKVHYPSPVDEYALIYAQAEAETFQNEQPIVKEIEIYGVTNFRQASRLAWFYLNQSITCKQTITFKTSKAGLDRTIWDLIAVTSTFGGFVEKKYRIIGMSEAQEGQIQITGIEYNENLYTDQQGSAAPVVNYVSIANAYGIPADVSYFQASQNLNLVQLNWTEISGMNITYEIREGASWEVGTIIAKELTGSNYSISLNGLGTKNYWIKAKNKYNYSKNAKQSILVITDIPQMNVIVSNNILTGGTFNNTVIYNNKLKLISDGTIWTDYSPELWTNNDTAKSYNQNGKWGCRVVTTGTYTSPVYDLGEVLNSIFSINYDAYLFDGQSSVVIEIRTSEDNITWSDWVLFSMGSYNCRYHQERITLNSPLKNQIYISNCILSVDVPDRIEHYNGLEITDANTGYVLIFATNPQSKISKSYSAIPAVILTPKAQTNIIQTAEYSNKTKNSVTIRLKDASTGAFLTGEFDCVVKGY